MFEVEVIKFLDDQPYIITQKVTAKPGTEVSGYLTYMTCNKEMCLPPTDVDFSFTLNPGAGGAGGAQAPTKSDTRPSAVAIPDSKPTTPVVNKVKEVAKSTVQTTTAAAPVVAAVKEKVATSQPVTEIKNVTGNIKETVSAAKEVALAEVSSHSSDMGSSHGESLSLIHI